MYWKVDLFLYCFLLVSALIALYVKDLLAAVVSLSVYSFIMAILFVLLGAADVGFTEAVVGAGVTGVLFIVMIYRTCRESTD